MCLHPYCFSKLSKLLKSMSLFAFLTFGWSSNRPRNMFARVLAAWSTIPFLRLIPELVFAGTCWITDKRSDIAGSADPSGFNGCGKVQFQMECAILNNFKWQSLIKLPVSDYKQPRLIFYKTVLSTLEGNICQ